MSIIRIFLFAALLANFLPIANAACPEPEIGSQPGWAERFRGELQVNDIAKAGDFEVKLTRVFTGDVVQVEISRLGSFYDRGSVIKGPDGILKKPDIRVELVSLDSSANKANLTLYTPQRANVTLNVTDIFAIKTVSERRRFFPNEEFQIEFTINNTGELPANNVFIYPEFGDFQVVSTDAKNTSLCQGSIYKFRYLLKTPNVRKAFNYTLYLRIVYSDENIQIPKIGEYSEIRSANIEIAPALLEIARSISNWTTASTDRELTVEVVLNNSGEADAFNVKWSDSPPLDFLVTRGTTSWNGSLVGGARRHLSYQVISDDPIICRSISTATYADRFGNEYIAFSNDATAKFAPYLTLDKTLDGVTYFLSPESSMSFGNKTVRLGERFNVSVRVKNKGNAIARGVLVNDTSGRRISGSNTFAGDLSPGQEISFVYVGEADSKDMNITASMNYFDLNLEVFNASSALEQETPNYCGKELKKVSYSVSGGLRLLFPDVVFTATNETKVLSEFEVEYNLSIKNNGTDGAHDVLVYIDPSDLRRAQLRYGGEILRGQPIYFSRELRAGSEQNFTLILRAPTVENETSFIITAWVNYTDFAGRVHSSNATTKFKVIKPKPAFAIVKLVEKELNFSVSAPNETEMGEYGTGVMSLASTGYAPLEKVNLTLALPPGIEFFSNDTRWEGRYEAQLKRENQTWYGFVNRIIWRSNFSRRQETTIEFLVRGATAGRYNIPYNVTFDGNRLSGAIPLLVRGPRLEMNKTLDRQNITVGNLIQVIVEVRNVGEAVARIVDIVDKPPANFQVTGDIRRTVENLLPGEATGVAYTMKPNQPGSYTSGVASVRWTDELGNEYLLESQDFGIEVQAPVEFPVLTKPPETTLPPTPVEAPIVPTLTRREVIITSILTVIVMMILIKLLTLSRPASKE